MTTELINQKNLTRQVIKENKMVVLRHKQEKESLVKQYHIKMKVANSIASQKLNVAKENTVLIQKR